MSEPKKKTETLREEDITNGRSVGRRGAIAIIGAGVVGSAVAAVGIASTPQPAKAQATDSDTGGNADEAGRGQTGHTDRDSGGDPTARATGSAGSAATPTVTPAEAPIRRVAAEAPAADPLPLS